MPTLLLLLSLARADDTPSAAIAGIGGASVADPSDTTALRTNPAAISLAERYDVQGSFLYGPERDLRWVAAIIDSQTSGFLSFGVSYAGTRTTSTPFHPDDLPPFGITGEELVNVQQRHDVHFSLAAPFLERRLSAGLGGSLNVLVTPWRGQEITGNLTLGVAARPVEWLSLGASFRDVLPVAKQNERPATATFGVRGGKEDLVFGAVEADVQLEGLDTIVGPPASVRAGIEGVVRFVRGRAGWQWDGPANLHTLRFGVGLGNTAGSLDYTLIVPVGSERSGGAGLQHVFSVTLHTAAISNQAEEEDALRGQGVRRDRR
jgi:hypothetical protein